MLSKRRCKAERRDAVSTREKAMERLCAKAAASRRCGVEAAFPEHLGKVQGLSEFVCGRLVPGSQSSV